MVNLNFFFFSLNELAFGEFLILLQMYMTVKVTLALHRYLMYLIFIFKMKYNLAGAFFIFVIVDQNILLILISIFYI